MALGGNLPLMTPSSLARRFGAIPAGLEPRLNARAGSYLTYVRLGYFMPALAAWNYEVTGEANFPCHVSRRSISCRRASRTPGLSRHQVGPMK